MAAFLRELKSVNDAYSSKLHSGKASEKKLRKLAWNVDDLSHFDDEFRKVRIESKQLQELCERPKETFLAVNAPRRL